MSQPDRRLIALPTILILMTAVAGRAKADITYTWSDDSLSGTTGSFTASSSALATGVITPADVLSYSFADPFQTFAGTDPVVYLIGVYSNDGPHISQTTGEFTDAGSGDFGMFDRSTGLRLDIFANAASNNPNGVLWEDSRGHGNTGHWVVQLSAAPEPAGLVILGIRAAAVLGHMRRRNAAV